MVDISQKPYFHYNDQIDQLMVPLKSLIDVKLDCFIRKFVDDKRFIISTNKDESINFVNEKLYQYGLFEKKHKLVQSSFQMWDAIVNPPPQIYQRKAIKFNMAHGVTIVRQHGHFCDFFNFSTHRGNIQANNVYLNERESFQSFIDEFYKRMERDLEELQFHTFSLPIGTVFIDYLAAKLSSRQQDCADLMSQGFTTKEIAKSLGLSPRTVESYLNDMIVKFEAKNRVHLASLLTKQLKILG